MRAEILTLIKSVFEHIKLITTKTTDKSTTPFDKQEFSKHTKFIKLID